MIENFCEFFARIEANPHELVKDLTVRDYLHARQHLSVCQTCHDSAERVVKRHKAENEEGDGGTYEVYTTLN